MAEVDAEVEAEPETILDREQTQLERWRLGTLREAGYTVLDAQVLAESKVDLHVAVDLVKAGCAPDLARRILL